MIGGCGFQPLSRDHHIPLRRQLAADLEAGIRDGRVKPGARLPSSRDLARRLGVDRGTVGAALARLRRRNLIEVRGGQRPRAASRPVPEWPGADPGRVVRTTVTGGARRVARSATLALLRQAHAGGLSRWEILRELERIVAGAGGGDPYRVTLCEPRPGLRAVLAAELEATRQVKVDCARTPCFAQPGHPVVVRRELLARLRRVDVVEFLPLTLAGGTRERALVRRRVRRGLVVLLSRSETVRVFGAELAARDFGRGISFTAVDPEREPRVAERALTAAAVVFHDRLTTRHVQSRSVPTVRITLIPRRELERLCGYLSMTSEEADRRVAVSGDRGSP